jgi:membrane-bound metal-dependent hydrolase YbcI (DUF457 family)
MDPFTHLLFGYLIGFGIWGPGQMQFVVAAALAGGLPDADVLLYPLARWVPAVRHRGLSHSIVGVTVIAAVGTFVLPPVFAHFLGASFGSGAPIYFFLALEVGGLSHILLDSLDHWSIPPFAPFSNQEYHLDAERIMNLGAMVFTVGSYAGMIYERGRASLWVWEVTTWTLLALAALYLGIRLLARWRAGIARRREGFGAVIPQANPFVFLLVDDDREGPCLHLRVGRYHLLRGFTAPPQTIDVPRTPDASGAVRDATDALERSYAPALAESWTLGETHPFAEVAAIPSGFEVFWYSLEFMVFGRASGVVARVDGATGAVQVRSAWRVPKTTLG